LIVAVPRVEGLNALVGVGGAAPRAQHAAMIVALFGCADLATIRASTTMPW
jgi:hypothetical protein